MRIPLLLSLLTLGACASPLPQPDAGKAWVDLYATAGYTLMAHRLDDQRWPDGRYFQVAPGAHQLDVRFQFEQAGARQRLRAAGVGGRYLEAQTHLQRMTSRGHLEVARILQHPLIHPHRLQARRQVDPGLSGVVPGWQQGAAAEDQGQGAEQQ